MTHRQGSLGWTGDDGMTSLSSVKTPAFQLSSPLLLLHQPRSTQLHGVPLSFHGGVMMLLRWGTVESQPARRLWARGFFCRRGYPAQVSSDLSEPVVRPDGEREEGVQTCG